MTLALDPWRGDHGGQIVVEDEWDNEEGSSPRGFAIPEEEGPWEPRDLWPASRPRTTVVIDGVMREDTSGRGNNFAPAMLCSYAAGAVIIGEATEIVTEPVQRRLIVGNGQSEDHLPVYAGNRMKDPLVYKALSTPDQPRKHLLQIMREAETAVIQKHSGPDRLMLADGNLTLHEWGFPVVGVIKTIHRLYLAPEHAPILTQLQNSQRTPLFRREGYRVYTCYLRLSSPRPIESHLAGLVRLEVQTQLGLQKAVEVLNQAAKRICELASRAPKDPRAPQNLVPVRGLELRLRHLLGDRMLLRRGIEKAVFAQREKTLVTEGRGNGESHRHTRRDPARILGMARRRRSDPG